MTTDWVSEWEQALADMELSVAEAEAALRSDHVPPARPWVRPEGLGPLPASLERRARVLLDRQTEVGRRVAEQIALGRRHAAAVRALRTGAAAMPVYVDVQG